MNLKLIESFVELIELGAFANKEDIVKGLNSAIKVTKEQAELTDEEITVCMGLLPKYNSEIVDEDLVKFARAILRKAQEK
jgi:hypothetical protein